MHELLARPEGRPVFKGSRLELRLVKLKVEGGDVEKEVVLHPGAVVVLPFLAEKEIVFIRNARLAIGRRLLELPAGTLEKDEAPISCARRELEEETGFAAATIKPLGTMFNAPGWSTYQLFSFVARDLTSGPQQLEKGEDIVVEVVRTSAICSMIAEGQIVDGKTLSTLAIYAAQHRGGDLGSL
jgi:ADP-ribose pyrophosphatase